MPILTFATELPLFFCVPLVRNSANPATTRNGAALTKIEVSPPCAPACSFAVFSRAIITLSKIAKNQTTTALLISWVTRSFLLPLAFHKRPGQLHICRLRDFHVALRTQHYMHIVSHPLHQSGLIRSIDAIGLRPCKRFLQQL